MSLHVSRLVKAVFLGSCLIMAAASLSGAASALTVISALPEGEVADLTQITVRFSEPMRALGVSDEPETSSPLKLSADYGTLPAGNFRWLDPATLAYLFAGPVDRPVTVSALVPRGVTALSGASLARDKAWTIATPALKLEVIRNGPLPRKNASITLFSNYPLDEKQLRNKATITADGKSFSYTIDQSHSAGYSHGRPSRWATVFSIKGDLPKNSTITLRLAAGVAARSGGTPAKAASFSFPTYGDLRLESWAIHGQERDNDAETAPPEGRLRLSFNNPVRLGDLLGHIIVTPEARIPDDARISADSVSAGFALPHTWKPRTTYTVTVRPGLRDGFGTTLNAQETITFTTGDYVPLLHMPGGRAILETPLASLFPVYARNAGAVSFRLRFLPWNERAFFLLANPADIPAEAFRAYPGARETVTVLNTAGYPNRTVREMLNIPALLGFSSPEDARGLFLVDVLPPGHATLAADKALAALYGGRFQTAKLQATDLSVAVRMGAGPGLAWVTGITDGKPVPGAAVRLADKTGKTLWQGTANASGMAVLPGYGDISGNVRFCIASSGTDVSVLDMAMSDMPGNADAYAKREARSRPWRIHAVSQLPLYQPGQDVNGLVFIRQFKMDDIRNIQSGWRIVAGEPVTLTVEDRRGRTVHTLEATANEYGAIPFAFTLAPDAEPGGYRIKAVSARLKGTAVAHPFTVASFRPPDFKVDVTPPASGPHPVNGNPVLRAVVQAGYFSGALLSGGAAALEGTVDWTWFAPDRLAGYATGPDQALLRWRPRERVQTFALTGALDREGRIALDLPAIKKQRGRPLTVGLTATVTDAASLASQGTASFMLHPAESYIGIRAPFLVLRDQPARIGLKAATWDNNPLTGTTVTLTAERTTYTVKPSGTEAVTETVWEKQIFLGNDLGDTVDAVFSKSGAYTLTASIRDAAGRENIACARVFVPGEGMEWARNRRTEHLEFLTEDREYAPGETARVAVKNPFDKAAALVSIERGGVLRTMLREVSGPSPVIDIPLEASDAPYVHAVITLITGRDAPPPDINAPGGTPDKGAPAFAQGGVLLKISGTDTGLAARVATDAEEYRPGGTVTASVRVTDAAGKGRKAQVTFLAVDERVLRAAGERTSWDPAATFQPLYPSGVYGAISLRDILNRAVPALNAGIFPYAYASQRALSAAALNAEMATADGAGGQEPVIRGDFSPLAFWLAARETDGNGTLTVTFALPDTLTGYRIAAVAADKSGAFATDETSIRASKPLQILSALPKFVTEGDTLHAAVLVQNTGKTSGAVTVTAKTPGAVLAENQRELSLRQGQTGTVSFPLKAPMLTGNEGSFTFQVFAGMDGETDAVEYTVPVLPARPVTVTAAAGLLGEGGRFTLPVAPPASLDPRSRLDVTFAPSPAAGIPMAAAQVLNYPWNCLEQRLSRAWAGILRVRHGDLMGLNSEPGDRGKIQADMLAVPAMQEKNGSFGLWPGVGGGNNLFLTAYAVLVSAEAAPLDMALPGETMDKALEYIEKTLRETPATCERPETFAAPAPEAYALALRALALYRPESAARLYSRVFDFCEASATNPLGWGALLAALDAIPPANVPAFKTRILARLEKTAAVTPTELHFASERDNGHWRTFGSRLRDNGMLLGAMAASAPQYPRLEALARWTGQRLGDTRFLSTQEAVFGLWGLARYLETMNTDGKAVASALWNGKDEASVTFSRLADPPVTWTIPQAKLNGGNSSALVLSSAKGTLYWTVRLAYASPAIRPGAENAGFAMTRAVSGDGPWKLGDVMRVTLTLTVPATRHHVLLFDPFPAGFEPLHATRADIAAREKTRQPPWQWQDALDHGMLLYAPVVHPGTYTYVYTLRAAAAGTFTQRPGQVEEMYTPEVFGRSGAGVVVVEEK